MVTKAERLAAVGAVIDLLTEAGFESAGHTDTQTVRIPTTKVPLYGKSGGELATFGGRARFALPSTNVRATVGKKTTYLYRVEGRGIEGIRKIASLDTADVEAVRATVEGIVAEMVPSSITP